MSPLTVVVAVSLCAACVLYLGGWFAPLELPDTGGYLRAATADNPWGFERHPLYGWMLIWLERWGVARAHVPALQFSAHGLAALSLAAAALVYGVGRPAALALGLAAILGQSVFIWGRALIPESIAVSLLVLAFSCALCAVRERLFPVAAAIMALAFATSCLLRPIMSPALLLLPLVYLLLCRIDRQGWRLGRAAVLVLALGAPLVAQSAHRLREVGDFGIVSFGGFGSLGVSAQVLTPDLLPRLPDAYRPLAEEVLAAKQKAVDAQAAMPLFRNSVGERSFRTTALDGFDTLARNFDEILWGQITSLQRPGESWVSFNARMGALSRNIMSAAPDRFLFWAVGASSRLVGRLFVYNAAFLLALGAFGLAALWNISRYGSALAGNEGKDWTVVSIIVTAWIVSTSALTVVAAFPALRYTDTAGLLLTALPLYGLFLALAKTNSADPA